MTAVAPSRPAPLAPGLFVVTVFASAALVFVVEPMIAKLVLPLLGGSAAVWNTSLAFFQGALLAGYIYAHFIQRIGSLRVQVCVHLVVLILAAFVLPLRVSGGFGDPSTSDPALWLVGTLALSIGAPFAALCATAPLAQAWHARIFAGAEGREPYALYAASNLGSLLALLAYPTLVEPGLTLRSQTASWSVGYGVFFVLILVLCAAVWRAAPYAGRTQMQAPAAAPDVGGVTWLDRARWIALAALPSSLMLGVTSYITTDVGSAPFLWVAPLALYLLSFIVAFQARPAISRPLALTLQAAAVVLCASFIHFLTGGFVQEVAIHLLSFFLTALICHQALVARRPSPERLTDFYICMSLGGVIGGSFNAFVAPLIFNTVIEYPAVLVLACLARPWAEGPLRRRLWGIGAAGALAAVVAVEIVHPAAPFRAFVAERIGGLDPSKLASPVLAVVAICAFLLRRRAWMFTIAVLVLTIAANRVGDRIDVLHSWRGFFGVLHESRVIEPRLGGEVHMLAHGTTMHGAQALSPAYSCQPLVYYAHETPIGQVFDGIEVRKSAIAIGAIGLGTGSVAAYSRPGDSLDFFEIDPLVVHVSTDPRNFSYTSRCARGPVRFVLGDARLTLSRQPPGRYDILLIDAFSSDSVPAHLLTVEAARMYLSKLKPGGVVILHLSNRNLDLVRPAEAVAIAAGARLLVQRHKANPLLPSLWESSEDAVILAKDDAALAPFAGDPRWSRVAPPGVRAWTDDYTNLFGALVRRTRERWAGINP
ncbi:MAG TPA: fused MFS/spermidine synthase [Caulobacteraceae bacterium]